MIGAQSRNDAMTDVLVAKLFGDTKVYVLLNRGNQVLQQGKQSAAIQPRLGLQAGPSEIRRQTRIVGIGRVDPFHR